MDFATLNHLAVFAAAISSFMLGGLWYGPIFALFLNDPAITLGQAVMYGFFVGFGWIAMGVFVIGLFEQRSMKLMLINGGFMTLALTVMGAILGAWR